MKEFTFNEILAEADRLREMIIVMHGTKAVENLMEYSIEHPDKAVLPPDFDESLIECPECGSAKILNTARDTDDYEFTEEEQAHTYVCKDCGHTFDDPEYANILQYWFIHPDWAQDLEDHGEHILYPDWTNPIWCRRGFGQSISLDGVFQELARESLEKKELAKKQ